MTLFDVWTKAEVNVAGGPQVKVRYNIDAGTYTAVLRPDLSIGDGHNRQESLKLFNHAAEGVPRIIPVTLAEGSPPDSKGRINEREAVSFGADADIRNIKYFFAERTMPSKLDDLKTYLALLSQLNERGWALGNHDPNGVYYARERTSGLAITNTDNLHEADTPDNAWLEEVNSQESVQSMLRAFFTTNMRSPIIADEQVTATIPRGIVHIIDNLHMYHSAREVLAAVRVWQSSDRAAAETKEADLAGRLVAVTFSNVDRDRGDATPS